MNDSVLLKTNSTGEKKILFSPRTGDELMKATFHKIPLVMYSDLTKVAKRIGAVRAVAHMFKQSLQNIILLQNPSNMMSGHWLSVSCNPKRKEIYFFSTYGGKPDVEKIEWLKPKELEKSNQDINIFNDALKVYQEKGWKIFYNDYPYQKKNDNTAVCGIYTVAFLRSNMNPDEFEDECKNIMKQGINPAIYFYEKYFC